MAALQQPRKLRASDSVDEFRCGAPALDEWLARYALMSQAAGTATVFVATTAAESLAAYYALAAGSVAVGAASTRVAKGVARHPVPVIVLTRLAVALEHRGAGLGRALLCDALVRVISAADLIGVRALLVHPKDDEARAFYLAQAEFESSPIDPLQLFLLIKDVKKAAGM